VISASFALSASLRAETSIAELCRREGIAESVYYSWPKEFLRKARQRSLERSAFVESIGQLNGALDLIGACPLLAPFATNKSSFRSHSLPHSFTLPDGVDLSRQALIEATVYVNCMPPFHTKWLITAPLFRGVVWHEIGGCDRGPRNA
jgi:hypothetical protein